MSFGTFSCKIHAYKIILIGQRVACVATIIPVVWNDPVGYSWAHGVIYNYRRQSDVAGDVMLKFTPVENYTSSSLKGLERTRVMLMYHSQA